MTDAGHERTAMRGWPTSIDLGQPPSDPRVAARAAAERLLTGDAPIATSPRPHFYGDVLPGLSVWSVVCPPSPSSSDPPQVTAGISEHSDLALAIAIIEAAERHCIQAIPQKDLVQRAMATDALGRRVGEDAFARYEGSRPVSDPPLADQASEWVKANELGSGEPIWLPAAAVFRARLGAERLPRLSSTGVAAHVWAGGATLAGLLEIFERDSLATWWHADSPLRAIDLQGTPLESVVKRARLQAELELEVFEVVSDWPFPTVLAVGSSGRHPRSVIGCACSTTLAASISKALTDALSTFAWLRTADAGPPDALRTPTDHALLYASEPHARSLRERARPTAGTLKLRDHQHALASGMVECLRHGVGALTAMGLLTAVVDITTPRVRDAGVLVMRVVVPGAVDIALGDEPLRLDAQRLRDAPLRLGFGSEELAAEKLSRLPIPLG